MATVPKRVPALVLGDKYGVFNNKLGSGSFGEVFEGQNLVTGQRLAIKLEKSSSKHQQLMYEYSVYSKCSHIVGIPKVYYVGCIRVDVKVLAGLCESAPEDFNVMVMELLGHNLESLFTYMGRKFTVKTVIMIALQLFERIENFHSVGYIHRILVYFLA